MFAETKVRQWWERRSSEQQATLKQAAENSKLDADTVRLLIDTRCPVGPVDTRWEAQPEFDWSWPEDVRAFIAAQE